MSTSTTNVRERLAKMKSKIEQNNQRITRELRENTSSHGSDSSVLNFTGSSVATTNVDSTVNSVCARGNRSAPTRMLAPTPSVSRQLPPSAHGDAVPYARTELKPIAEQCAANGGSRSQTDLSPKKPVALAETQNSPVKKKARSQSAVGERRAPAKPSVPAAAPRPGPGAELPPTGKQPKEYVIKGKRYRPFGKAIGAGGSSKVYQALDEDDHTVAIKRVSLKGLDKTVRDAYENEIRLLSSLQGSPFVITLHRYETKGDLLYVVLEKGEKDLHRFLLEEYQTIDAKFIKYYWQELLKCVRYIHNKKIVHSDLKPANFLFVGAKLKLIDFGIASKIPQDSTSIIKDTQFGTISYMSPEALHGDQQRYKISEKSDVWSLGCILYAMVYQKTPFQDIPNAMARMQAITSESHEIQYPPCDDELLLDVMKKCLIRDAKKRASVEELLNHDYLCDKPSSQSAADGSCAALDETLADEKVEEALEELSKCTPRSQIKKMRMFMGAKNRKH